MAGNLMKTDEELKRAEEEKMKKTKLLRTRAKEEVRKNLLEDMSSFLSSTLNSLEDKKQDEMIARLSRFKKDFLEREIVIYEEICGRSFSSKENP